MPDNPILIVIWALVGAALGFAMYWFLGGDMLTHMAIGAVAAVAAGFISRSQRDKD